MTEPTFDPRTLRALHEDLGSDAEVTSDIVRTFLRSADDLIVEARVALDKKDARTVMRVAHTLRSSAATLGAVRLATLARAAEGRMREGGGPDASEVEAIAEELTRAKSAIAAWRP